MNARRMLAEMLMCMPGFVDLGGEGWAFRPRRQERREAEQTDEQRDRAIAKAEAKRARKRAKRIAASDREAAPARCPDCGGSGQVEVGQHRGGGPINAPCERCRPREWRAWERAHDAAAERREEMSR